MNREALENVLLALHRSDPERWDRTGKALAERLDTPHKTLQNWMFGRTPPRGFLEPALVHVVECEEGLDWTFASRHGEPIVRPRSAGEKAHD